MSEIQATYKNCVPPSRNEFIQFKQEYFSDEANRTYYSRSCQSICHCVIDRAVSL